MKVKEATEILTKYSWAMNGDDQTSFLYARDIEPKRIAEAIRVVLDELEFQSQSVLAMGAIADNYKKISIEATNDLNAIIRGETYICNACNKSDSDMPCSVGRCYERGEWRGSVASK